MSPKYKPGFLTTLLMALLLSGCGAEKAEAQPSAAPEALEAEALQTVIVTEFMEKNKAVIRDEDGDFSDYIELYNPGKEPVSLKGWRISDDPEQKGWKFPDVSIEAGEYLLLFASNKEKEGGAELHADFALSGDEGVYLKDAEGKLIYQVRCGDCSGDTAMQLSAEGEWVQSLFPSPGYENSPEGYEAFQQGIVASGPLVINEVMSFDDSLHWAGTRGYCDWLEIKNISERPVQLSDYRLSDDDKELGLYTLPEWELGPGECYVISCDDTPGSFNDIYPNSGFALSSDGEQLYLSNSEGDIADFVFIHSVPYGCSYGRNDGKAGWFYMSSPTPGKDNSEGRRMIAESPVSLTRDGVYENVDSVEVSLSGEGCIRYTLDGSMPTEESPEYTGPVSLSETCVLRAACFRENALPSLPLNLSFIINEGHSLPVVSLVSDSPLEFRRMYDGMAKDVEQPGAVSFFRGEERFEIGCGISLNGETSLVLPKKNMSLRFRGAYGDAQLQHDIYGGGVTEFTNLLLRSGQDFEYAIIRNELAQSLCEKAEMKVINQRSIWCVLYINGEYSGLYTLKEKANEQLYASLAGVSRDSVTVYEANVPYGTDFYSDVVSFATLNDMSVDENYRQFCSVMDVDSLIDWLIIEGFCSNYDLSSGNLRYARSTENDGKWRLMFYDLDAAFRTTSGMYYNLLTEYGANNYQVGAIAYALKANPDFRHSFLSRTAELYKSVLNNETVLAEIDRISAEIYPEVGRDYGRFTQNISEWEKDLNVLRELFYDGYWQQLCIDAVCTVFEVGGTERQNYFGEIDGK